MHASREPYLAALKCILCYIQGTLNMGLLLRPSALADLVVYSNADWAGCPDTRKSTSGYVMFLGDNLSSKRLATISPSSAKAEYRAVANAVAEATWLRQLLLELHVPPRCSSLHYTWPPTPFSISAPSTSKSTFTSFGNELPLVNSVFSIFRHHFSSQTSSPKGCLLRCSLSFGPVRMFAVLLF
ncbi:LOW QUALITY PROTEIN: hypothetical protein U9M48_031801 [Paspalum notatum var. saurae]|uniref:Uncharacterized protein n=1 Tax=Paspalum notatum var. saurae TaxID=547442 RepID=A0AAQ3U4N8_PASNO